MDEIKEYLRYEPNTGNLYWIKKPSKRTKIGKKAGTIRKDGYVKVQFRKKEYLGHRIAWFLFYGYLPEFIDHINRIKNDNRLINLKVADHSTNSLNRGVQTNNTSGYKGVSWDNERKKYRVYVWKNKKRYYVGSFDCSKEAHKAYCRKGLELHGEDFYPS